MTRHTATLLEGLAFAEGLRWHGGRLWFADMHAGEVHAWSPAAGDAVIADFPGPVSGLGWAPGSGDMYVVSMEDRTLVRVGEGGERTIAAALGSYTSDPINDLVVDGCGRAYVGTFGFDLHGGAEFVPGVILQVDPDGSHRVVADDLWFPNGMVLTDGGCTLVCAETFAGRLTAFTVLADGRLSDRRTWADLPQGALPDGICLDAEGAVWAASTETSECLRIIEGGEVVDRIGVGDCMAVACTLGGDDGHTLYVATSGHLAPEDCRAHRDSTIEGVEVEVGAAP